MCYVGGEEGSASSRGRVPNGGQEQAAWPGRDDRGPGPRRGLAIGGKSLVGADGRDATGAQPNPIEQTALAIAELVARRLGEWPSPTAMARRLGHLLLPSRRPPIWLPVRASPIAGAQTPGQLGFVLQQAVGTRYSRRQARGGPVAHRGRRSFRRSRTTGQFPTVRRSDRRLSRSRAGSTPLG